MYVLDSVLNFYGHKHIAWLVNNMDMQKKNIQLSWLSEQSDMFQCYLVIIST